MVNSLTQFLESKTLYYDKIDYDVIAKSWQILKEHIELPFVIHVIGTNGKGSTGRFIASIIHQNNKSLVHYSSPHIVEFNERIWINGSNSTDEELNFAHLKLQERLPENLIEQLTYFEYTTLVAILLSSEMDYIVLEAGLGGEFDATNVVPNNLTVVTTIDLDHQDFLGNTIEEIASTKMRSCDESYILSHQINDEVYTIQQEILKDKKEVKLKSYAPTKISKKLPLYLQENLNTALSVIQYLNLSIENFILPELFGRFQKVANNITIDVGHNPLAAKVIYEQLIAENKKIILIYNSYKDKDYEKVLEILSPVIKEIQIIECDDKRIVEKNVLISKINNLCLNINSFDIMKLNIDDDYLVFGSFIVIESFLKEYKN